MAALVTGIAESVGLQLLLQPSSSSVIFRAACLAVGVAYPAYQTLKVLDTTSTDHQAEGHWLRYWAVYATVEAAERYASSVVRWIPFYWHLKLGFLLWLQLPSLQGARRLVMRLQPLLRRHQADIDSTLEALHLSVVRPEFRKAATVVRASLSAVPVFGWLLRTPEEDEALLQQRGQSGPRAALVPSDTARALSDRRPLPELLKLPGHQQSVRYGDSLCSAVYDSDGGGSSYGGGPPGNLSSNQYVARSHSHGGAPYGGYDRGQLNSPNGGLHGSGFIAEDGSGSGGARSKRRRNVAGRPRSGPQADDAAGGSLPQWPPVNRDEP